MRKFGLIGYPLSHSFSQKYFSEKFQKEGISDAEYENFPLPDLHSLAPLLASSPSLEGLNVTIPYKQEVLSYLDFSDEIVEQTGACNCIRIRKGKLYGFNTDVTGFEQSLQKKLQAWHEKALVLGTGGASKAVQYVLKKRGIDYSLVSRRPGQAGKTFTYDQLERELVRSCTLLINTTPLGMFPLLDAFPPIPYDAIGKDHLLFDLIYNPQKTLFLKKGEEQGAVIQNGLEMLTVQAEESWRIWKDSDPVI
jgi:shikimate dehydrogenase